MAEVVCRIRLTPSDRDLKNPHKGCCTFQHFNGQPLYPGWSWSEEGPVEFHEPGAISPAELRSIPLGSPVEGYLPSTVAYCRWFWTVLEPKKGQYNFDLIEKALTSARAHGQSLAVRLMAYGSPKQPQLPDWYQQCSPTFTRKVKSAPQVVPDHDSKEYFQYWGGLIRAFGQRFDGHPDLETIDISYIGPWGEGAGDCTDETCQRFAELWKEAFPKTPRLALIGEPQMAPAMKTGAGWRCDCFGDCRAHGSSTVAKLQSWAQMYEFYPRAVIQCGGSDAWKTAPIHFEACSVPGTWEYFDYDFDFICQQGLKYHGTYFMPKYTRLPERYMDKLAAFCRHLGYRYIYRHVVYDRQVPANGHLNLTSWIENVGVAPIYRRYDLAYRFRQGDNETILTQDDLDIRTWLPGDVWLDRKLKLPDSIHRGCVDLAVGLVDPQSKQAKVSFAVKEVFSDRWVDLGGFEVV